jgi:hypothetical protein
MVSEGSGLLRLKVEVLENSFRIPCMLGVSVSLRSLALSVKSSLDVTSEKIIISAFV